jgi:hypothetical protein
MVPLAAFLPFPLVSNMSLLGTDVGVTLSISDVIVESLDDIVEVEIFRPYEETCVTSEVKWERMSVQVDVQLEAVVNALPHLPLPLPPSNDVRSRASASLPYPLLDKAVAVQFIFENVTLESAQQIFLDQRKIDNLFSGEIFTPRFECLLKLVDLFHALSFHVLSDFSNISFSSPNSSVIPLERVLADVVTLFAYAAGPDLLDIANHLFMADLVPGFNNVSDRVLSEKSSQQCLKGGSGSGLDGHITLIGFFVTLMIAAAFMGYVTYKDWVFGRSAGRRLRSEDTKLLTVTGTTNYSSNDIGQYLVESQEVACVSVESQLPWIVRAGLLASVMCVSGMMVSYLSGTGASVFLDLHLSWEGENILHFPSLFDFSFLSCIHLFKESRVYLSALLIGLGGLFDPVIIIVLVVFVWIAPPSYMLSRTRISVLQTCMSYAKWIVISGFLLDLLGVAFKIYVSPPAFRDSYFELFVFGRYAFFANLLAWIGLCLLLLAVYYCQLHYTRKYPAEMKGQEIESEDEVARYSPSKVCIFFA